MYHEIDINKDKEAIFQALTSEIGLKSWWTSQTEFNPKEKTYKFGFMNGKYWFAFKIIKQEENKIEWECINADSLSKDWIKTKLIFDIVKTNDHTTLKFTHANWNESSEVFSRCNTTWGFLMFSLKNYLENGKGMPIS